MARVDSVKEQHNNMLPSVVKSMIAGGVAGYAAKYALPLTKQEKDEAYWKRIAIIRRESIDEKAIAIDEIRKLAKRTEAQDTFLKMVDLHKTNPAPSHKTEMVTMLRKLDENSRHELKSIISKVNAYRVKMTKQHIDFYNKGLKGIRQSTPFVAFGIIVGFVAGVAYNVMRAPLNDANA